jgi:hypothetical protein
VLWKEKIADALAENRFESALPADFRDPGGEGQPYGKRCCGCATPPGDWFTPNQFIPVAEQTGLIQAIDHWVLTRAIAIMQAHPGLRLSVNLSANALDDPFVAV